MFDPSFRNFNHSRHVGSIMSRYVWVAANPKLTLQLRHHGKRAHHRFKCPQWLSERLAQHRIVVPEVDGIQILGILEVVPGEVVDELAQLSREERLQFECPGAGWKIAESPLRILCVFAS